MLTASDFRPENVAVDALRPHPRNYREHPPDQLDHIARSIELHGFYRNIVVARDNTILAGHGVCLAARKAGHVEVPIYRVDIDPDDTRALQLLAGDNEISRLAEIDDRALSELLRDVAEGDLANLLGTGFDDMALAALTMVSRPASEIGSMDEAAEWAGLPGFEQADDAITLLVKFTSEADRKALLDLMGVEKEPSRVGGGFTVWWPKDERNDVASVRFQ